MWCIDNEGMQYFAVSPADATPAHVTKFVSTYHDQKKANRALIASYGPEFVEPEEEVVLPDPPVVTESEAFSDDEETY